MKHLELVVIVVVWLLSMHAIAPAAVALPPVVYPCAMLKLGVWLYGLPGVIKKAKARGYTQAQITAATKACS